MKEKEKFVGFDTHEYRPIARTKTLEILVDIIQKEKPKQVLEIGTFIGYSASVMLETSLDIFVTTIEKDTQNACDAKKNLSEQGYDGRFEVINCDAFDFLVNNCDKQFDLIFLDGPKGQYIKYLPYLKKMLKTGAYLVCDDILFYGLVRSNEFIPHKHRSLVVNLRKFLSELEQDSSLDTKIYDLENGVSVSKKL